MDEFLKSKAMMTPGVAGAVTTMITGTLVSQFGLPGNWTGLVVSLLLGLVVWVDKSVAVYHRSDFSRSGSGNSRYPSPPCCSAQAAP